MLYNVTNRIAEIGKPVAKGIVRFVWYPWFKAPSAQEVADYQQLHSAPGVRQGWDPVPAIAIAIGVLMILGACGVL